MINLTFYFFIFHLIFFFFSVQIANSQNGGINTPRVMWFAIKAMLEKKSAWYVCDFSDYGRKIKMETDTLGLIFKF